MTYRVGVRIHREQVPESAMAYAQRIEALGFDEVWVVEDLSFGGGLTAATAVLAATSRLRVGIGILAAVVRNPAYAAMEIATLERMFPGRVTVGIGHGVQSWMAAVGARVASPLTALGETLTALADLLAGGRVSTDGRYVHLDDVSLAFPPAAPPAILAGVRGPKSLAVAGATCDGVLLAEPATPDYVTWAGGLVRAASADAQRPAPSIAVYAWLSVDDDGERARAKLRPVLAANLGDPEARIHLHGRPFGAELVRRLEAAPDGLARAEAIELDWAGQLGVAGTPAECVQAVERLAAAGADSIILLPLPGEEGSQVQRFGDDVLPAVNR